MSNADSHLSAVEILAKKRDGHELTKEEVYFFINGFHSGEIADYQMSAMCMAIFLRGMTDTETSNLTMAMARTGTVADWSSVEGPKVDKHSTGGVGDKVSLVLAPLAAALGLRVPMMSGRGLGHTGGTLDKLEAIPGFSTSVSSQRFTEIVGSVGCAIVGPTSDIAPVDKRIYALRDVTATVASLPLICSSIMSKKLAENPDALVLDVKTGRGAFMPKWEDSVELAKAMVATGENNNIPSVALLTGMDQPLGLAIGNWLETREAIDILRGGGPADVVEVTIETAAHMMILGGKASSLEEGRQKAAAALQDGSALAKFTGMVKAQQGDISFVHDTSTYPEAKHKHEVMAPQAGFVTYIDCLEIGLTCVGMGGGRKKVEDSIDYAAGMLFAKKVGDRVELGDILVTLYANKEELLAPAATRVAKAFVLGSSAPEPTQLIRGMVTKDGLQMFSPSVASPRKRKAENDLQ